MGGFGSGRPAQHVTCEAALKIDLAEPAIRAALGLARDSTGAWRWSANGRDLASIGYAWSHATATLTFNYRCDEKPVRQEVRLAATQPHFGGARLWFICPFSKRWVRALYLPPGGTLWGSRHAYRLTYRSRRESGQGRALMRMLTRFGDWPGDRLCAAALLNERDPLGIDEERRWDRREEARQRRNEVRRIARRERASNAEASLSRA